MIPIIQNSLKYTDKTAVIDQGGSYSYSDLYRSAVNTAKAIKSLSENDSPVLYMIPSGFDYLKVQWGNLALWANCCAGTYCPSKTGNRLSD